MSSSLYSIYAPEIPGASKDLLGGKGYGLYKMAKEGIPVPPAYVITTDVCRAYMEDPDKVMAEVKDVMIPVMRMGFKKEFGFMPLVAVRSGARDSMPGMMDTILNVGLDDDSFPLWSENLGAPCAFNSYERLIEMYGSVVNSVERKSFERKTCVERLDFYKKAVGSVFPNADEQLFGAIEAVFKSWNNDRAKTYRRLNNIPDSLGTAVVIQSMVFGNFNDKSGTGVAFSRNFTTGANEVVGDFLPNAQGEDVVAGIRTPEPLSALSAWNPEVGEELVSIMEKLEGMYRDMVDVEFTIQGGKLFMLQVRAGKRTAKAAVRIALDLVDEKVIGFEEAIERVNLKQLLLSNRPSIPAAFLAKNPASAVGTGASNGVASGVAVFSSAEAISCKVPCILIAEETTPDDIGGMNAARGILTSTGGATSHAAVVARGMDKVCVVGCSALTVHHGKGAQIDGRVISPGDKITLDGTTGSVWVNVDVPVEEASGAAAEEFMGRLIEHYGVYRTVVSEKECAGAKKLLVETYLLDRAYHGDELYAAMSNLLLAIGEKEAIIDLRCMSDIVREADAPLEFMFGAQPGSALSTKVSVLKDLAKNPALKNVRVLEAGLDSSFDVVGAKEELVKAGYALIPMVKTLPALLAVKGLCMSDFPVLLKTMSEEDVAAIVSLKKKAGEDIRSFNIVDELSPDDLGRSALFALSGLQAAQSFLRREVV